MMTAMTNHIILRHPVIYNHNNNLFNGSKICPVPIISSFGMKSIKTKFFSVLILRKIISKQNREKSYWGDVWLRRHAKTMQKLAWLRRQFQIKLVSAQLLFLSIYCFLFMFLEFFFFFPFLA